MLVLKCPNNMNRPPSCLGYKRRYIRYMGLRGPVSQLLLYFDVQHLILYSYSYDRIVQSLDTWTDTYFYTLKNKVIIIQ